MFAMIENRGVADIRAFTKLGLSSARNRSDKIGQFGSGAKHGVLTLIRKGLNPYIYCGKTKLQFFSQPSRMQDTTYNDMFVKVDNAKPVELSYCLEFGELDWNDINMGLREIVSNAIDNAEPQGEFAIKIVEQPRAKDGFTRVFIPLNSDVQQFVNTLSDRFLHFGENINKVVLPKQEDGQAKIYRKGVFVRQMESWNEKSLFDYNFGDELTIDECRNANEWDCKRQIGSILSTDDRMLRTMFERFINGNMHDKLEDSMSEFHLKPSKEWAKVWNDLAGENAVIILPANATLSEFLVKKGFKPYFIPDGWYKAMSKVEGIRRGVDCLSKIENEGYSIVEPTERACEIRDELWGWLSDLELTAKKDKPEIKCFSMVIQNGNGTLMGYREGNTIFINIDFVDNKQTYLEEIAHYVTDACDGTREFQEFAFQIATRMGELIFN